jgi:DNA processing protein
MRVTDAALNALTALTFQGIGRAWVVEHASAIKSTDALVSLLDDRLQTEQPVTLKEFERRKYDIEESLDALRGYADGVVAIGEDEFPPHRGDVTDAHRPVALFYRGDLSLLSTMHTNVAVIGLLNPDEHTMAFEREVVRALVDGGATIVSGLAAGCDTVAHDETLRCGGKTIAILPSPLDKILPTRNWQLADDIVDKGGLLVTEYYTQPENRQELIRRYPERDRLQALFSDWVVLTASYDKNNEGNDSGSRHALDAAKKYRLPRAVMYNAALDTGNPKYELNRRLIREDRAVLTISRENLDEAVQQILSSRQPPLVFE